MDTNQQYNQIIINNRNQRLKKSIIILGLLFPAVLFLTYIISLFSDSRQALSDNAQKEIIGKWGTPITLSTPYITSKDNNIFYPSTFDTNVLAKSEIRYRGIHKCVVFFSDVKIKTKFKTDKKGLLSLEIPCGKMRINKIECFLNGKKLNIKENRPIENCYYYANIIAENPETELNIDINMSIKGIKNISIKPYAKNNSITMSSNWNSPSFQGDYLPDERSVSKDGFNAKWNIANDESGKNDYLINVEMYIPLNAYALVNRATSYAFLFLIIYMFSLLLAEYFANREVDKIQYLMASLTPPMFYLLLLSISEHLTFGTAFLISATMSSGLIALYMGAVLKAKKVAMSIFATNAVAYAMIYILLTRETFALLIGTLTLFAILATIMALTTNLNQKEQ